MALRRGEQRLPCQATLENGAPCKNWAMRGEVYCRMHIGFDKRKNTALAKGAMQAEQMAIAESMQNRGLMAADIKDGRLAMDFQKFMRLPAFELLSQKESIALLNAREKEIVRSFDTGESGRLWFDLRDLCARIQDEQDAESKLRLLDGLIDLVMKGALGHERWNEAVFIMRQRDALVQTEQRQQKMNADYMHIDDVMGVIERIGQAVMRHVQEPRVRDAIAKDIDAVVAA